MVWDEEHSTTAKTFEDRGLMLAFKDCDFVEGLPFPGSTLLFGSYDCLLSRFLSPHSVFAGENLPLLVTAIPPICLSEVIRGGENTPWTIIQ